MSNTNVVLSDEMGYRVPNITSVTILPSDTVTFTVEEGADSALYFSPETASILSPQPGPRVELDFGQELIYTFAAPAASAYGVITQAPEVSPPETFDFGAPSDPPSLVIQVGAGINYGGPTNTPIP
jgi:hypothetical protein